MPRNPERSTPARRQWGFTLLELAIVLVVIALVVSSALAAAAVMSQARLRSLVNDHARLSAAIHMYRDRYAALPGDDPRAAIRWSNARNGDGDAVISGWYDDVPPADPSTMTVDATTGETLLFWWHLRLAGLIPGPTSGPGALAPPTSLVGNRVGVQTGYMGLGGLALCMDYVDAKLASGLESHIDDGNARTGIVRGFALAPDGSITPVANGQYRESAADVYLMCVSLTSATGNTAATKNGKGNGNGNGKGNGNGNGTSNGNGNGNGQ